MSDFDYRMESSRLGRLLEGIGSEILTLRESDDLQIQEKEGHWDIVTAADKQSEGRLTEYVQEHYPYHGIVGEEGTLVASKSDYIWRFDPIDGTANYERGSDFFGISAGLARNDISIFGMIHYPALKKTLAAFQGYGAVLMQDGQEVELHAHRWTRPPAKTLKKALVVTNIQMGKEHLFGIVRPCVKMASMYNSMVFDTLQLALGKVDALFHTGATPFDIAAGIVIAREAGCVVSGINSHEIDFSQEKIPIVMARSEGLCEELRKILIPALR